MADETAPLTNERLAEIRDNESRNLAKLFDSTVTELLAEVDRLRATLEEVEQNHEKWVKFVRTELDNLRDERDRLRSQVSQYRRSADEHVQKFDRKHEALLKARAEIDQLMAELMAAKLTSFENNGVGDVAAHIQAETVNDLRLN